MQSLCQISFGKPENDSLRFSSTLMLLKANDCSCDRLELERSRAQPRTRVERATPTSRAPRPTHARTTAASRRAASDERAEGIDRTAYA